ncbi:hypothetical protein ACFRCI_36255 [Streptomyces sp. NPDC056638]|uniref:hypothetical protein n=1 Tax=Streptomyces sp. NPDC056638 TaxID=3345887 RepID=UPI0036C06B68
MNAYPQRTSQLGQFGIPPGYLPSRRTQHDARSTPRPWCTRPPPPRTRPPRATGPGWVAGIDRTGAVVGPWLGGTAIEGGNAGLRFTTFAVTAVPGAVAIRLVPMARRTQCEPAAQQTSAPSGAIG